MKQKDSADYFDLEPVTEGLLGTPVPVVDLEAVDADLPRLQARCHALGRMNRSHIKTHKLVGPAQYQIGLGAVGITVRKLAEAEVMADAGIGEMLMTFDVVGTPKLGPLAPLAKRANISVVADNAVVVEGIAWAGQKARRDISVPVECETGAGGIAVATPKDAADLARLIGLPPKGGPV